MLRWLAEHLLQAFNYVPELFVNEGDPHFDVLRWWLVLVVVIVLMVLGLMVRKAFRQRHAGKAGQHNPLI